MTYIEVINNAINYLEDNLTEDIKVDTVASEFYFSKFHFYRIFRALTGYTISEYIDLRKLTNVCFHLKNSNKSILDIALDCGFNSHEVLTRKFKKAYGITPFKYRKSDIVINELSKIKLIKRDFINKKSDLIVNFEAKYIDDRTIRGKNCNNGYDDHIDEHTIGNFLFEFADECFAKYPEGSLYLTVMYLDRETNSIEYFVGFDDYLDDRYETECIKASKYAVFKYKGVFKDNIKAITNDIYRTIVISGIELNDVGVEFLEVYNKEYLQTGIFEIQVPIK